ncbi:hypothetical protein PMIN01_12656 [Paraphaeosphaeria minitans]|uniref:Uncharacterized protein n=1 Tax=Paraphaeosphaeria minitans TaxID=565426 RepID=A0A9P6KJW5_9PLEO|nr:hypothetical protein PMIN01_12656 [Paraphaeosphaeria minitans]
MRHGTVAGVLLSPATVDEQRCICALDPAKDWRLGCASPLVCVKNRPADRGGGSSGGRRLEGRIAAVSNDGLYGAVGLDRWLDRRQPTHWPTGGELDAGCWMLDAGHWMLDAGCWMLERWNETPSTNVYLTNGQSTSVYLSSPRALDPPLPSQRPPNEWTWAERSSGRPNTTSGSSALPLISSQQRERARERVVANSSQTARFSVIWSEGSGANEQREAQLRRKSTLSFCAAKRDRGKPASWVQPFVACFASDWPPSPVTLDSQRKCHSRRPRTLPPPLHEAEEESGSRDADVYTVSTRVGMLRTAGEYVMARTDEAAVLQCSLLSATCDQGAVPTYLPYR